MKSTKHKQTILVVALSCVVVGALAWVGFQAMAPIAAMHSANNPHNRSRPAVSGMQGVVAQVSKRLGLTPTQQADMLLMAQDTEKLTHAISTDPSLTDAQKNVKLQEAMNALIQKVGKVLSPEQNTGFLKMLAEMHQAGRQAT